MKKWMDPRSHPFLHTITFILYFYNPKAYPLLQDSFPPSVFLFISSSPFLLFITFIINNYFFQKITKENKRIKRKENEEINEKGEGEKASGRKKIYNYKRES